MTLQELIETLQELVSDGMDKDTKVVISHEFDGVNLVEGILDIEPDLIRNRDVVALVCNGDDITLRN